MNIKLTDREKEFLKQYAKVYDEERKVDCTADPIVVVEERRSILTMEGFEDGVEYVWEDEVYDNLEELRKALDESDLSDIEKIEILDDLKIYDNALEGKIRSYYVKYTYRPVAYFLTRTEAEKYTKYQSHNLGKYRIYTRYCGYGNQGDMQCLTKMLLRLGKKLLESEVK